MRSPAGWHVVECGKGGTRGHRGVVHPDEYVNAAALRAMVERELGYTLDDLRRAYQGRGRRTAAQRARRAEVDARLLTLADAGANMDLFGRVMGLNESTLDRALARARAA